MEFNGTFLATIITFIVFVFVMNKVLYEPVLGIMEKRKNFIDENYADAEENNKKAEELEQQHDEKIIEAKDEARVKYNEFVDGYKNQRNEVIQTTQQEVNKDLQEKYETLQNVSQEAKESLKGRMNELANDIVEKVLGYRSDVQGFDDDSVNRILYR